MEDCKHREMRIEGAIGSNVEAFLICMECGQKHNMTTEEVALYDAFKGRAPADGLFLAQLLKEEDRRVDDPDFVYKG